jgi:hypothetical protein
MFRGLNGTELAVAPAELRDIFTRLLFGLTVARAFSARAS